MSRDLASDADPVPGPPLPGISAQRLAIIRRWSAALVIIAAVLVVAWFLARGYADFLWYHQLGYGYVFLYLKIIKTSLFVVGGLLAATLVALNIAMVLPLALGPISRPLPPDFLRLAMALLRLVIYGTLLICGLVFGSQAAGHWQLVLMLLHQAPFGLADPQFGRDVTFYVVNLQVLRAAQVWFLALFITIIVIALALYAAIYLIRGLSFVLTPRTLRHLALLGITLMLVLAFHHVLDVYELTLSPSGVVTGATYTDIHARIPVYWFLAAIGLLAAAIMGYAAIKSLPSPWGRGAGGEGVPRAGGDGLRLMAGAFSLWLLMFLLAGILYPALFQRFQVNPDEFAREEPYIQRNIQATRAAFGLDQIQETAYPVSESLSQTAAGANRDAIDGIRLWDAAPLQDAYNQLQFMELYYHFLNMDSDRYLVDGRLRQVLVGARELDPDNLPADARNWVNQRLQYTHGYGVSMTPATAFTPGEGRPQYFIQDIPIKGQLPVTRPEIYYGESPIRFAIVNTAMPEVTPNSSPLPGGDGPGVRASWHYDGDGGVPLDSWLRRILYTLRFADINILLSDQVSTAGAAPIAGTGTAGTGAPSPARIQFHRHVRERVKTIAPFLKLDHDPYPVLDSQGKLWWIQDAYTATGNYPYSTRISPLPLGEGPGVRASRLNYIRNSVKAVVDAYNGGVTLYVMDPGEPLLRMYRNAFPTLFQPFEDMPQDLQPHIRYPVALFSAQADTYLRYHVTDPQVFFNQAEQWDIPLETRLGKDGVRVTPTYLLMRLPSMDVGADLGVRPDVEFVLLMPFSPAGQKKNLVGWLAARNDPPNYGQLLAFHIPDDRQIDGPSQVEARIENDQEFSQLFTLWAGPGSEIIRGRLLPIPIADTIVYVEPLYLKSEFLDFPELKKVILADNTNLVMADSMAEAVARLTGQPVGDDLLPSTSTGEGQDGGDGLDQLDQIEATIEELEEALKDLQRSLQNLRNTLGGNSP